MWTLNDQIGSNKSSLVTSVASLVWLPVYDEWDGDIYTGPDASGSKERNLHKDADNEKDKEIEEEFETGQVVFKGDKLPWQVGTYEVSGSLWFEG